MNLKVNTIGLIYLTASEVIKQKQVFYVISKSLNRKDDEYFYNFNRMSSKYVLRRLFNFITVHSRYLEYFNRFVLELILTFYHD